MLLGSKKRAAVEDACSDARGGSSKVVVYAGKRPSGSPPFEIVRQIFDWSDDQSIRAEYYAAYPKDDGFQVVIDQTGCNVVLRTKRGVDYGHSKGRLAELDAMIRRRFANVVHASVTHPKAGVVIRFYAEVTCNTGDGDDLGALMHGALNPTHLRVFDCDFAKDGVRVPLPNKLALLRKRIGAEHVMSTLLDTRRPVTKAQLDALEMCLIEKEGIIVEYRGRKLKHKVALPLPLHLLGVGFTPIGPVAAVPSHFVWGVPTAPGCFAVVLIDDRRYLCDPVRADEGKMHIDPSEFAGLTCTNDSFIGKNYNALLAMVKEVPLVDAAQGGSLHSVQVAGAVYTIETNRSFHFGSAAFKFLAAPVMGVVGCNCLWLTQSKHMGPGSVHLQAPQFLASKNYGHPIHQMLIPGFFDPEYPDPVDVPPLTADSLVLLASIVRNAHAHAEIVYGPNVKVDLVFGVRVESSPYNTPGHSEDEDA